MVALLPHDREYTGGRRLFLGAEENGGGPDFIAIAEDRDHPGFEIDGDDNRAIGNVSLVPVPFAIFDRAGDRQDALDDEAVIRCRRRA